MRPYLNNIIGILLLFTFTIPSFAQKSLYYTADLTNQYTRMAKHYGTNIKTNRKQRLRKIRAVKKKAPGSITALGHQGQTILLLMILSGVDLVKQHYTKAEILNTDIDSEEFFSHVSMAAEHILVSGEVWGSLVGAGAASVAAAKPLSVFNEFIKNTQSRAIFKNVIIAGISSFIAFIGWEFGGQLYREARELLEYEDDYNMAQNLMGMIGKSLKNGLNLEQTGSEEWRVLKLIFGNMKDILWSHQELRDRLIYNTWRTKIATGEFVSMLSSMVTSSAVGSTLFPGAGTVAGMCFGLVGGVGAVFVPENIKTDITGALSVGRRRFWSAGKSLGDGVRKQVVDIAVKTIKNKDPMPSMLKFPRNHNALNKISTTHFEALYKLNNKLQRLHKGIFAATDIRNFRTVIKLEKELKEVEKDYAKNLDSIIDLYHQETIFLEQIIKESGISIYKTPELVKKYPIINEVFDEYKRVHLAVMALDYFREASVLEKTDSHSNHSKALRRIYLFGFDIDLFLSFL